MTDCSEWCMPGTYWEIGPPGPKTTEVPMGDIELPGGCTLGKGEGEWPDVRGE